VEIADNHLKLYEIGKRLLNDRANVSIKYYQIIVTIHELKHDDYYKFTVIASGGLFNRKLSSENKTFTVENIQGNNLLFAYEISIL